MTIFDAIKDRVTALDAAELYGLQFGRNHRALCPWHDDKHPDLAFYADTGTCYCFTCHNGGDAIALTAQIFGLSQLDAARKLNSDFNLRLDTGKPLSRDEIVQIEKRKAEKQKALDDKRREWDMLCRVKSTAESQLQTIAAQNADDYDKAWDNPEFVKALEYRSRVECDLDRVWADKVVTRK